MAKEEKLSTAFHYFDQKKTGFITLDSVLDALKKSNVFVDVDLMKQTFKELDIKEKRISFEEFKSIVLSKSSR